MGKMLGLKALLVLPILVAPLALEGGPVVVGTDSLIPIGVVLLVAGAVWKAATDLQKLNGTIRLLIRRTNHLGHRVDRAEQVLQLPAMPEEIEE